MSYHVAYYRGLIEHSMLWNLNDDEETEIVVRYTTEGGCAARLYGRPEDCYPAEDPEITITSIRLNEPNSPVLEVSEEELKRISDSVIEAAMWNW